MRRLICTVALTCNFALAAGATVPLEADACTRPCPDDDADGRCAPDCAACVCCPHFRVMAAHSQPGLPIPLASARVAEQPQAMPQSPEPGEILHVPIAPLA